MVWGNFWKLGIFGAGSIHFLIFTAKKELIFFFQMAPTRGLYDDFLLSYDFLNLFTPHDFSRFSPFSRRSRYFKKRLLLATSAKIQSYFSVLVSYKGRSYHRIAPFLWTTSVIILITPYLRRTHIPSLSSAASALFSRG